MKFDLSSRIFLFLIVISSIVFLFSVDGTNFAFGPEATPRLPDGGGVTNTVEITFGTNLPNTGAPWDHADAPIGAYAYLLKVDGTIVAVVYDNGVFTGPTTFAWNEGTSHSYEWLSGQTTTTKRFIWQSTSGLGSSQTETITVTASGSIIANYNIESLTSSPPPSSQDSDGDGIPDNEDNCPSEAETNNGYQDTDGCYDDTADIPNADTGGPQPAGTPPPPCNGGDSFSSSVSLPSAKCSQWTGTLYYRFTYDGSTHYVVVDHPGYEQWTPHTYYIYLAGKDLIFESNHSFTFTVNDEAKNKIASFQGGGNTVSIDLAKAKQTTASQSQSTTQSQAGSQTTNESTAATDLVGKWSGSAQLHDVGGYCYIDANVSTDVTLTGNQIDAPFSIVVTNVQATIPEYSSSCGFPSMTVHTTGTLDGSRVSLTSNDATLGFVAYNGVYDGYKVRLDISSDWFSGTANLNPTNPTPKLSEEFGKFDFDVDVDTYISLKQGQKIDTLVTVKHVRGEAKPVTLTLTDWGSADISTEFERNNIIPTASTKLFIKTTCNTKPDNYLISVRGETKGTFATSEDRIMVTVEKSEDCQGTATSSTQPTSPEVIPQDEPSRYEPTEITPLKPFEGTTDEEKSKIGEIMPIKGTFMVTKIDDGSIVNSNGITEASILKTGNEANTNIKIQSDNGGTVNLGKDTKVGTVQVSLGGKQGEDSRADEERKLALTLLTLLVYQTIQEQEADEEREFKRQSEKFWLEEKEYLKRMHEDPILRRIDNFVQKVTDSVFYVIKQGSFHRDVSAEEKKKQESVITPQAIITPKNTDYEVIVTDDSTRLNVLDGVVEVMALDESGKTIEVNSGESLIISPTQFEKTVLDTNSIDKWWEVSAEQESPTGGGCLIATAAYGSELAPQVQFLREIRDNTVLSTASGASFMTTFNSFYYSFSPTIADLERQNPVFKETVKVAITPLITTLSLLQYVDIDSEAEMLGYGIGIIILNIGMYFVAPVIVIYSIKKII